MRPHGLTQARWVVMIHLRRGGNGFKQKALAKFVGIEGPTLVEGDDTVYAVPLGWRLTVDTMGCFVITSSES